MKTRYIIALLAIFIGGNMLMASSHREAPLISNDPLADNTDLYAFRSPDDPSTVTFIANYIPGQLPHGGPNYYSFGENIRYQIHIDNDVSTAGDDIIYRVVFSKVNNDPTTFFNIRLGAENLQTSYTLEKSTDGGASFQTILTDGIVPPNNIGDRSIQSGVGLGAYSHERLIENAIATASTGETVYCGPAEDPFFVDLGGVFDLGDLPRQDSEARDGLECYNVHSIAIKVPINLLQKEGKAVSEAADILDGDFVIGVWASASRPAMRTLNADQGTESYSGDWVQVSRLGMPLTNEAVIPIGAKDEWNALTPYNENPAHYEYFHNPELGLYMDDDLFGGAVPAFGPLRIQEASLAGLLGPGHPGFDFTNGADGLFGLKGSAAVAGTALDDAVFGTLLLPAAGKPRSVDLWPAFHTGVPNFPPYQLATGKMGNPLNPGKPFVNNFLPNGGDMLRLNMATPVTPRTSPQFSSLGLIQAAVLGLTDPTYASSTAIQSIPNMDGFPNGRRLEDDVTRIELQAVAGAVLAAVGLWYDDFDVTDPAASPLTPGLLGVLSYSTGVDANDQAFRKSFPYVAAPYSGTGPCSGRIAEDAAPLVVDCELVVQTDVICSLVNGDYNAILAVSIANGTPPYTVSVWDETVVLDEGSTVTSSFGPFTDGGFDVIVTDAANCSVQLTQVEFPCSPALSVELVEFTGSAETDGNLLQWITASEQNSKNFVLEHSIDGNHFSVVNVQDAAGSTNTRSEYSHMHLNAPSGISYYKLSELSLDGTQKTYGVIAIEREQTTGFGITDMYPNPTLAQLNIDIESMENGAVTYEIYDAAGRMIITNTIDAVEGSNPLSIDVSSLQNGSYFVHLKQNNSFVTTRFVKG